MATMLISGEVSRPYSTPPPEPTVAQTVDSTAAVVGGVVSPPAPPAPLSVRRLFAGMIVVAQEIARTRGHVVDEVIHDSDPKAVIGLQAALLCRACGKGGSISLSVDDDPLTGRLFSSPCGPVTSAFDHA